MTPHPSAAAHLPLDPATTDETLATIFAAQRHDPGSTPAQLQSLREAGAAFIGELRPRDPVEAANAARAVGALRRHGMLPPRHAARHAGQRGTPLERQGHGAVAHEHGVGSHAAAVPGGDPARPTAATAAAGGPAGHAPASSRGRGGPTSRCHRSEAGWEARPHVQ